MVRQYAIRIYNQIAQRVMESLISLPQLFPAACASAMASGLPIQISLLNTGHARMPPFGDTQTRPDDQKHRLSAIPLAADYGAAALSPHFARRASCSVAPLVGFSRPMNPRLSGARMRVAPSARPANLIGGLGAATRGSAPAHEQALVPPIGASVNRRHMRRKRWSRLSAPA